MQFNFSTYSKLQNPSQVSLQVTEYTGIKVAGIMLTHKEQSNRIKDHRKATKAKVWLIRRENYKPL